MQRQGPGGAAGRASTGRVLDSLTAADGGVAKSSVLARSPSAAGWSRPRSTRERRGVTTEEIG